MPRLDRFYHAHPDIVVHIEAFEDGVDLQSSDIDLAEQGLGALLCGDILIADAIDAGGMQRIDGPALPGFTYRLILSAGVECTRAAYRFTAWLRD